MPDTLPPSSDGRLIPVSVKAVVRIGDAVLLGENDRAEWELPGGRLEPGETLQLAVRREVLDETGLHVEVGATVLDEVFEVVPSALVRIVALRCATLDDPGAMRPSHEHRRVALVPLVALPGLALPDVYRRAIDAAHPSSVS